MAHRLCSGLSPATPRARVPVETLPQMSFPSQPRCVRKGKHLHLLPATDVSLDSIQDVLRRAAVSDLILAQAADSGRTDDGKYPLDPEHLICNGLGGAFLHPTHVFAPARFAPIAGRDADDAFVHSCGPKPSFMPGVRQ